MEAILTKTATFILIILLGYLLKRLGILKREDSGIVSKLIMNLTLPCALLTSSKDIQINGITLILIAFALFINIFAFYFGVLSSRGQATKVERAVSALNISGFNIGNFAIPFVQSFYNSSCIGYICMFDLGNAVCGFGLIYFLSSLYVRNDSRFDVRELVDKLLKSVPFMTYIFIVILSLLKLQLPAFLQVTVSTVGDANVFLSMILIGLLLEFHTGHGESKNVVRILVLRVACAVLGTVIAFLLPIPHYAKVMLLFCMFTPTTSITPIYCLKHDYDGATPAVVSTLSMITSIVIYVFLLLIFK